MKLFKRGVDSILRSIFMYLSFIAVNEVGGQNNRNTCQSHCFHIVICYIVIIEILILATLNPNMWME